MQLQIQGNTSANLIAMQGAQPSSSEVWVWMITAIIFLMWAIFTRNRKMLIVPLILAMLGVVSKVLPNPKHSYRMSIDYQSGSVRCEEFINGAKHSEQVTALADVASAEMQYNRDATRIALILRNGEQRFPLGQYHFNNEPDQYVILTKIRSLIGQTAFVAR